MDIVDLVRKKAKSYKREVDEKFALDFEKVPVCTTHTPSTAHVFRHTGNDNRSELHLIAGFIH
jgi:hypothetical protein